MQQKEAKRKRNKLVAAGRLTMTYYTDPLCCWSWAFLNVIDQWRADYPGEVQLRFCMGGMVAGWQQYNDEVRAVTKPLQMGPVWLEAKQMAGIQLDDTIWFRDPPASSYPACLAVKAATLQSDVLGAHYLKAAQAAVMTGGRNIAKKEVLLTIAAEVAAEQPDFDTALFAEQLGAPGAVAALRADLAEVQTSGVTRFPTLLISREGLGGKLVLTGYRPLEALQASMQQLMDR